MADQITWGDFDGLVPNTINPVIADARTKIDQFSSVIPMVGIEGNAYAYGRYANEASGSRPNRTTGAVTLHAIAPSNYTAQLVTLQETIPVTEEELRKSPEMMEMSLELQASAAVFNDLAADLGGYDDAGVHGLKSFIQSSGSQDIITADADLTLSDLTNLIGAVDPSLGNICIVANAKAKSAIIKVMSTIYQASTFASFSPLGNVLVPAVLGVPVLLLEKLPNYADASNVTESASGNYGTIFAVALGEQGFFAITDKNNPGLHFWPEVGLSEPTAENMRKCKRAMMYVQTVLKSTRGIARLRGFQLT